MVVGYLMPRRCTVSWIIRYTIPLATIGLALAITLGLHADQHHPSVVFLAGVTLSAWFGGLGPGLLATVLSVITINYYFIPELGRIDFGSNTWVWLGTYAGVSLLISSLHEKQRRLIAALRRQDRQKSSFLAELAHELRNFLAPLSSALAITRAHSSANDKSRRACEIAERQLSNMTHLVDDLLDASRVAEGKVTLARQPVNLIGLMDQVVAGTRSLVESRGHKLEVRCANKELMVEADAFRLEQVLINLLTNAAKYTDPGGKITILGETKEGSAIITIRDNGKGLDPEFLPHVFDLFVQAQPGSRGGLGIGLNVAKRIVEMHGGTIKARSAGLGYGSDFVISLPAYNPSVVMTPVAASNP
jgi:signal transduction histidine kinase